ncbi:MAG: class II fructose-bisphosphate aldolase [Saccharofermentanales bacterium]|jgi:ketose-bisphosphate aldolase
MLCTSKEMINKAYKEGYAVPSINTQGGTYDIIRAICDIAEERRSPVILAHYMSTGIYAGHDWFVEVAKWCADKVSVPVAIHLDHGDSFETAMYCLKLGFTSLMVDFSNDPIKENAKKTNEVIRVSKEFGVPVEAEVGVLARIDQYNDEEKTQITKFEDVVEFLEICRPDMLALGVGNAHGFYTSEPNINQSLLIKTKEYANTPLVLHGGTGIPERMIKEAISNGIAKINFGTLVRTKYVEFLQEAFHSINHNNHSWKISQYAKQKLEKIINQIIDLSGSANKV